MRFFVFFLVITVLVSVLGVYVHRRATHVFSLEKRGRWLLGSTFGLGLALFFLRRVIGSDVIGKELVIVGAGFAMAIVLAAGLLFHVDLVRGLWWLGERVVARLRGTTPGGQSAGAVAAGIAGRLAAAPVASDPREPLVALLERCSDLAPPALRRPLAHALDDVEARG